LRTVAAILANPRYTGRQVWNRQRTDHHDTDPDTPTGRRRASHSWNPKDQWIISRKVVHPALVSDRDFVAAQTVTALPTPSSGGARRYLLTGLVTCRTCGRRADAHWVHGRPGYRCRHGHTSASPPQPGRPKAMYVREDRLLAALPRLIDNHAGQGEVDHDPRHEAHTCAPTASGSPTTATASR
jgi:site-specific DNA recombinase